MLLEFIVDDQRHLLTGQNETKTLNQSHRNTFRMDNSSYAVFNGIGANLFAFKNNINTTTTIGKTVNDNTIPSAKNISH